jgi:hypothetical protein
MQKDMFAKEKAGFANDEDCFAKEKMALQSNI